MYKKLKLHFVGIGGVGMSGIAEVLLNLGYPVSGSDLKSSTVTVRLKKKGAKIHYGHASTNVGDADVVVVSSAVKKTNPEVIEATSREIPIIQRAEMLAELMRFSRYGIAIAGSHGKTTTTSLIAHLLHEGGYDPTLIIGGRVNNFRSNARLGKGEFMVAEADESDGSFLKLSPTLSVITNIDREHMDYYETFERLTQAYVDFADKVPFYGANVCCIDHPVVKKLLPQIKKRVITYGFSEEAYYSAKDVVAEGPVTSYDLYIAGEKRQRIHLNLAGSHNVLNSMAALAVGIEVGVNQKKMFKALETFKGIHRRMEVLLKNNAVTVIDDYGHHPEEIKATIDAVRNAYTGRLVVFFQPHRYTRTRDLFAEFVRSFDRSNVLMLTDIYAASETALPDVSSQALAAAITEHGHPDCHYIAKDKSVVENALKFVKPGDVLLTLGAGDITHLGRECAKKLKNFTPSLELIA